MTPEEKEIIKQELKPVAFGVGSGVVIVLLIFGISWSIGAVEYTKTVKITDYLGRVHEYPQLKANPLSAYFEVQILNKNRFADGRPYLTTYSIAGYTFTPYHPLSENHFQEFEVGHTYVIERPFWNDDIIPLMEVDPPDEIPFKIILKDNWECGCERK
jgi:hypothetical protein